ncbi:MAG: type IIL restriction-modification enzyme MmeI, partial [Gammaproteobacteria bacterium]
MNIVDIEQALIEIAQKPYNPQALGLEFVAAFAKSSTTVKRLKESSSNVSDIASGLLWRGYMHYASAAQGMTADVLEQLKLSKASVKHKVRLLISTDGHELLVFDRKHDELLVTSLTPEELSKEPAFFFPLAGLEAFRPREESIIDIKATGKLAKLYDALIANNPDWESHRHELNHFITQIIFCLFSEDTDIFPKDIFTKTLTNRAGKAGEKATSVITAVFTIMNKTEADRDGFEDWEKEFPYVNGGLFSGDVYVPSIDHKAFRFLQDASSLDWSQVNPDILGSSIQAIVDPTMRGNLGMHYTSVQNILKTLSPLFLDELREELFKARYNKNKIRVFLDRLSKIKVFDPACGSG